MCMNAGFGELQSVSCLFTKRASVGHTVKYGCGCEVLSSRGGFPCSRMGTFSASVYFCIQFWDLNSSFFVMLPPPCGETKLKNRALTSCDIFSAAATIVCIRSAARKQSGYCVPLGWPVPIQRAPTPPTMTTRGTDTRCCARRLVVSWSCSSSVFNLSVIVQVMTENDILPDIGFC